MNTHLITDSHYSPDEEMYIAFVGTHEECTNYKQEQSQISFADSFMLNVVPMTEKELYEYNPDYKEVIDKKLITKHEGDKAIIDYAFYEKENNYGSINEMRQAYDDISSSIDDYNMNIFKDR